MNPYLLRSLELGPKSLARIVACVPESRYDERADPERFTLREAVAHLADFEPRFRQRMLDADAHPGVTVTAYDEGQLAIENRYGDQDVEEQLALFAKERAITAAFLRSLPLADFEKSFVHPEIGPLSIEDAANHLLGHDLYHVEQISGYL